MAPRRRDQNASCLFDAPVVILVSPAINQTGSTEQGRLTYRRVMSAAPAGPEPALPAAADAASSGTDLAEQRLVRAIRDLRPPAGGPGGQRDRGPAHLGQPVRPGSSLTVARCLSLFDAQLASRHLDLAARWLRARGAGYYTIGSSGHEGNAGVAAALRLTDPALLHYRSGAFYLVRAAQASPPRERHAPTCCSDSPPPRPSRSRAA